MLHNSITCNIINNIVVNIMAVCVSGYYWTNARGTERNTQSDKDGKTRVEYQWAIYTLSNS